METDLTSGDHVYIVLRSTGEYSDREEILLIAYDNVEAARHHVAMAARSWDARNPMQKADEDDSTSWDWPEGTFTPWDPDFASDGGYGETPSYYMAKVPKACLLLSEVLKLK
jgi:hypothetical protein